MVPEALVQASSVHRMCACIARWCLPAHKGLPQPRNQTQAENMSTTSSIRYFSRGRLKWQLLQCKMLPLYHAFHLKLGSFQLFHNCPSLTCVIYAVDQWPESTP